MARYLSLYKSFLKASIIAELQYRGNFFLQVLVNLGWGLVYILLYSFIFAHIEKVGDWTYERSLVLAATFLIIQTINKFLFRQNLKKFSQMIYLGDLDLVLTKPLSSQFYISLKQFYLRPFVRFILAIIILLIVLAQTGIKVSFVSFMSFLVIIVISTVIVYSLWFMSCCSAFWLGNIENIYELFHPILRITALPLDILPGFLKEIFFFVIPLVFIATIPAKTLLGLVSWSTILYGFIISIVLLFLSHKLWNFALKNYSSASS
ncbi:ABC transporter permease [Patescibacteria group bacterium]